MQRYGLNFISDSDFLAHVTDTIGKYRFKMSLKRAGFNAIALNESERDVHVIPCG